MPIVDSQEIFCDKQIVTAPTYSQRSVDFEINADYGLGRALYVHVIPQGDFDNGLQVQVVGSEDGEFNKVDVIGQSGNVLAEDLKFGNDFYIQIVPTGKKYRLIALKFNTLTVAEGGAVTVNTEIVKGKTGVNSLPAVTAVGEETQPVANAIRAQIEFVPVMRKLSYPSANSDKVYTA